jgi:hypothetical protein
MAQSLSAGPSIAPLSKSLLNKSADAQKKLKAESENTATKSSVSSDSRQAFQDSQKDEYVRMMEELFLEGRDVRQMSTCTIGASQISNISWN